MKSILYISFLVYCISCSAPYGYQSRGYFLEYNYIGEDPIFSTYLPYEPNDIPKITDGLHSYYVWKTVKYNHKVDEEEYFSSYRTLLDAEIADLNAQELQYIRKPNSLLNNYLFFIDDYRFIYLSEDDERSGNSYGQLPLYFDNKHYKLDDSYGSPYDQLIRGYYHKEGDLLFLDFGGEKHFYVKAHFENAERTLQFDSILVPRLDMLKVSGIDNPFIAFEDILYSSPNSHESALPVFELPNTGDVVADNDFMLITGFLNHPHKPSKRNPLHDSILNEYTHFHDIEFEQIISIEYDFSNPFQPQRKYVIEFVRSFPDDVKRDTITEDLREVPTW